MAKIRFFGTYQFTLPASPGAASTQIALTPANYDGGPFMGISEPSYQAPLNTNPGLGVDASSGVILERYRVSFLGAKGLRPASIDPTTTQNAFQIVMGRTQELLGVNSPITLSFTSNEWEDVNLEWKFHAIADSLATPKFFQSIIFPASIYVDTRNLQTIYYGQPARVLIEIDASAITNI